MVYEDGTEVNWEEGDEEYDEEVYDEDDGDQPGDGQGEVNAVRPEVPGATEGQVSTPPISQPPPPSPAVGGALRNMTTCTPPTAVQAGVVQDPVHTRLQAQQHHAYIPGRARADQWSNQGVAFSDAPARGRMAASGDDTESIESTQSMISKITREEIPVTVTGSGLDMGSDKNVHNVSVKAGSDSDCSSDTVTGPEQGAKLSFHEAQTLADSEVSTELSDAGYSDPVPEASLVCRVRCECGQGRQRAGKRFLQWHGCGKGSRTALVLRSEAQDTTE